MASMIVSSVTNQLKDIIKEQAKSKIKLVVGVDKEIYELGLRFECLQAFLNDAERRQMSEKRVGRWLIDLKLVAYQMEDVLDQWRTEMLRIQIEQLKRRTNEDDLEDGDHDQGANSNNLEVLSNLCSVFSCLETSWVRSTLLSYFNTIKTLPLRYDIGSRIKEIKTKLDLIDRAKDEFKFSINDTIGEGFHTQRRRETSSIMVDRPNTIGRESDQEIIVNSLLGVESSTNHIENGTRDPRIISIIGMGGLGKTTLAQLVFDHDKVKCLFKLTMWACVSDPFDRTKVAKAIFRAATGNETDASTWDALFKDLCDSVKGKKFFLVLDDVWTSHPDDLKDLTHLLDIGEQGSRILVTTRKEAVVSVLNSYKHILQGLNSEDSSSLLHRKAFHGREKEKNEVLEDIGTQIANKCRGLPLALSLLGGLLNQKINENHWRRVLESKIWQLKSFDRQKKLVDPVFLLSYDGLESHLKNCFQYCAIFPKAHKIRKRTLISLWMAQGFLNSSNEEKDCELIGEEYFEELAERSFFQDFSEDDVGRVSCQMHDLVHDFAQYLAEDYCYKSYNNEENFGSPIHLSLIYDEHDGGLNSFHNSIRKIDNVRTIYRVGKYNLSSDLIHHLRCLRVLKLKRMGITDIPNEIDKLIHLRYLDLSWNEELSELPDSMCGLINLQTLKLKMCGALIELPKEMGKMINLRNLDTRDAFRLEYLPKGIRNWKSLQTLSTFIVSATAEGCKIEELKNLIHLKECLEIKGLGRLKSEEQAAEAELQKKSQLSELKLDFDPPEGTLDSPSSDSEILQPSSEALEAGRVTESVLGNLQPHANLKKMTIRNHSGFRFPSWMGDGRALTNLRFLKLSRCSNCVELPALGLLPSLEELVISILNNLKRIGVEIYCGGGGGQYVPEVAFPNLITLVIYGTENLEVWEFGNGEVQVGEMMPRVRSIELSGCTNLIALPALNKLPSLETLKIEYADKLTSIACDTMSSSGGKSFPKLTTLEVSYMCNLEVIVRGADTLTEGEKGDANNEIAMMPRLVDLTLADCPKFRLPSSLQSLSSLNLCVSHGDDHFLVRLGEIIRYKELKRLRINAEFHKSYLELIPEYLTDLRQLEHLVIFNCYGIYEAGDWSILSHVPDIIIRGEKIDPLTYPTPYDRYLYSGDTAMVKWQEELLKVEIELRLPPIFFKSQWYYLTGVPPENQKITYNGALVKDYDDWSLNIWILEGCAKGIAVDEIVKAPEKGPVFMEDIQEEQQAIAVGHTTGLYNLEITSYMNSTLQCLHSVPELKSELINYSGKTDDLYQFSHLLTIATRDLFGELDRNVKPVSLKQFWMMLCIRYPQFSQQHNGALMQQDAEECWTLIMYILSQSLRAPYGSQNPEIVKKLFGIDLISRFHCEESGEESLEEESKYLLKCRMSHEVNHLQEGLKHGLKTELKKISPSLGRSSVYLKESRINDLPRYLTVQFVRFFWNRGSNQKEMNLQKVECPLELDVYELCSDELRKKLEAARKLLIDEEGRKPGSRINEKKPIETDVKMRDAEGSSSEIGEISTSSSHEGSTSKGEGQLTGVYELVSVLTHKGRSADSGHYVAWVKQESGMWIQFDDDKAILRCEEDITKLSGGGDWHTAYICMYKARVIPN